ncbi:MULTISPECIES: type II toxin-antitoxin system HipA family toxin [Actinoalloteichus]|uniref:HipA domain-containing protein n=1 Tax=Actinoalloteichus fjordicus TaxID=1612552 RepID=A0AAC9PTP2_9PSEU|nr:MULTISPECIES: type II toxin-antitoxin system HipA family toxin [Actinoalloteichus]APU16358.1 HipA domain-containing protein [Actinoalloteichus fjordicus]APU22416.1 HipA domain-containing protein [Actinoalloteichus sp. GBA129-24]
MTIRETAHAVWLHDQRVGTLFQRGDHTRFVLQEAYREDPDRAVLGLDFEQDLTRRHAAHLRLPPWFSNLLPEGRLRQWIAVDRRVSADREMELLAQVGHDLPGAVRVLADDEPPDLSEWDKAAQQARSPVTTHPAWRFSLAGVGLKFSMLAQGERFTLPAFGEGGDWIVKLPDAHHSQVPSNEYTMMTLAAAVGIDVPDRRLVHREELTGLPPGTWPGREEWAFAVRRFDRDENRRPVHIEDLAQVRGFYPDDKYHGAYETVAALIYRRRDPAALREFVRRLTFCILISNGDAHLKNWSLIYPDRRVPTLSPAYDLVATAPYRDHVDEPENLALKFGRGRRFSAVNATTFARLAHKLHAPDLADDLVSESVTVVDRMREHWPRCGEEIAKHPELHRQVAASIAEHSMSLLRTGH